LLAGRSGAAVGPDSVLFAETEKKRKRKTVMPTQISLITKVVFIFVRGKTAGVFGWLRCFMQNIADQYV